MRYEVILVLNLILECGILSNNDEYIMHEILELNTLLRGEDSERVQLEKKKLSLSTTVKHQESRFLHEFEEIAKLEKDLAKFESHAEKIFSEILPGLNIQSRSSEVDGLVRSIANLLQERAEIQNLIKEAKEESSLLNKSISEQPSEVEISKASVLCENKRKIDQLNDVIQSLEQEQLNATETQKKLQMEIDNLQNSLSDLETNILHINSTFSEMLNEKDHLVNRISEIKKEISDIEETKSSLALQLDEYRKQYCLSYFDYQKTFKDKTYLLEVEKQRLSEIQYHGYQQHSELQVINKQVQQLMKQSTDLKEKEEKQKMDTSFSASELRILREEQELLKKQQYSFSQHSYRDRLHELDANITQMKQTVNKIMQESKTLESYIKNPETDAYLQQQFQEIQNGLTRKLKLIQKIDKELNDLKDNQMFIEESEQLMMKRENLLKPDWKKAHKEMQDGDDILVDWRAKSVLNDDLYATVERNKKKLSDEFALLQDETDKLIAIDKNVELLKGNQRLQEEEKKQQLDKRQRLKNSEVSKRLVLLRKKKQEELHEAIKVMEDALLEEDRIFQTTISSLETKLLTKKKELQTQLLKTKIILPQSVNVPEPVVEEPLLTKMSGRQNMKRSFHNVWSNPVQSIDIPENQLPQTETNHQLSMSNTANKSVKQLSMPKDAIPREYLQEKRNIQQQQSQSHQGQYQQQKTSISSMKNKNNDKENAGIGHRVSAIFTPTLMETKSVNKQQHQYEQQEQQPPLKKQARMRAVDI